VDAYVPSIRLKRDVGFEFLCKEFEANFRGVIGFVDNELNCRVHFKDDRLADLCDIDVRDVINFKHNIYWSVSTIVPTHKQEVVAHAIGVELTIGIFRNVGAVNNHRVVWVRVHEGIEEAD